MRTVRLNRSLDSLTDTEDLEKMWTLMRPELECRVGRKNYIPLPHLTDGNCYGVGSVFVKVDESGVCCTYKCTFLPLGPIEELVEHYWHRKHPSLYSDCSEFDACQYFKATQTDEGTKLEDAGFSIILQDPKNSKLIKVNVDGLYSRPIPFGLDPLKSIRFTRASIPELKNTNVVYLVTAVKEADRLELSGTIGPRTRIYHIVDRYPLFFKIGKFMINEGGDIIKEMKCKPSTNRTQWIRVNKTENIDDVPLPDWKMSESEKRASSFSDGMSNLSMHSTSLEN